MNQSLVFDLDLIKRYDKARPRYTSYPTALELHDGFTEAHYREEIVKSNALGGPLSLYFHIPFLIRNICMVFEKYLAQNISNSSQK